MKSIRIIPFLAVETQNGNREKSLADFRIF